MNKKVVVISIIFVVLDQLIKLIITNNLYLGETLKIIPNFFDITKVHNYGAAWSMFSGNVIILAIIGVIALIFIYSFFVYKKDLHKLEIITYSLLLGGIIGNLIDRIVLGYVVDYLSFNIFGYMFPVFNLADMGIVISVLLIIIMSIQEEIKCKKLK